MVATDAAHAGATILCHGNPTQGKRLRSKTLRGRLRYRPGALSDGSIEVNPRGSPEMEI
jgi:hypothetical protein